MRIVCFATTQSPTPFQPSQIMATPPLKIPNEVKPIKTEEDKGEKKAAVPRGKSVP